MTNPHLSTTNLHLCPRHRCLHLLMINPHLQLCVIPHLLTGISGIVHLQVANQVDLGCKGSNPNNLLCPGRPIEMNILVGDVNPLAGMGGTSKEVQATTRKEVQVITQIGDIKEIDLETEIIIEITETIAETNIGMIVAEEGITEAIEGMIETITDGIVEASQDVIEATVIEAVIGAVTGAVTDPGIEVETGAGTEAGIGPGIDHAIVVIGEGQTQIGIGASVKQNYLVTGKKLKLQKKFPSSSVRTKRLKNHQCNIQENPLMYLDLLVLGNQNHLGMMMSYHFEQTNNEFG